MGEVLGGHLKLCLPPTWILVFGILPLFGRFTIELPHLLRSHDIYIPKCMVRPHLVSHVEVPQ